MSHKTPIEVTFSPSSASLPAQHAITPPPQPLPPPAAQNASSTTSSTTSDPFSAHFTFSAVSPPSLPPTSLPSGAQLSGVAQSEDDFGYPPIDPHYRSVFARAARTHQDAQLDSLRDSDVAAELAVMEAQEQCWGDLSASSLEALGLLRGAASLPTAEGWAGARAGHCKLCAAEQCECKAGTRRGPLSCDGGPQFALAQYRPAHPRTSAVDAGDGAAAPFTPLHAAGAYPDDGGVRPTPGARIASPAASGTSDGPETVPLAMFLAASPTEAQAAPASHVDGLAMGSPSERQKHAGAMGKMSPAAAAAMGLGPGAGAGASMAHAENAELYRALSGACAHTHHRQGSPLSHLHTPRPPHEASADMGAGDAHQSAEPLHQDAVAAPTHHAHATPAALLRELVSQAALFTTCPDALTGAGPARVGRWLALGARGKATLRRLSVRGARESECEEEEEEEREEEQDAAAGGPGVSPLRAAWRAAVAGAELDGRVAVAQRAREQELAQRSVWDARASTCPQRELGGAGWWLCPSLVAGVTAPCELFLPAAPLHAPETSNNHRTTLPPLPPLPVGFHHFLAPDAALLRVCQCARCVAVVRAIDRSGRDGTDAEEPSGEFERVCGEPVALAHARTRSLCGRLAPSARVGQLLLTGADGTCAHAYTITSYDELDEHTRARSPTLAAFPATLFLPRVAVLIAHKPLPHLAHLALAAANALAGDACPCSPAPTTAVAPVTQLREGAAGAATEATGAVAKGADVSITTATPPASASALQPFTQPLPLAAPVLALPLLLQALATALSHSWLTAPPPTPTRALPRGPPAVAAPVALSLATAPPRWRAAFAACPAFALDLLQRCRCAHCAVQLAATQGASNTHGRSHGRVMPGLPRPLALLLAAHVLALAHASPLLPPPAAAPTLPLLRVPVALVLQLLEALLAETPLLITASDAYAAGALAEALLTALYPLPFAMPLIPTLPAALATITHAPTPYLISGTHALAAAAPATALVFDVDAGVITVPQVPAPSPAARTRDFPHYLLGRSPAHSRRSPPTPRAPPDAPLVLGAGGAVEAVVAAEADREVAAAVALALAAGDGSVDAAARAVVGVTGSLSATADADEAANEEDDDVTESSVLSDEDEGDEDSLSPSGDATTSVSRSRSRSVAARGEGVLERGDAETDTVREWALPTHVLPLQVRCLIEAALVAAAGAARRASAQAWAGGAVGLGAREAAHKERRKPCTLAVLADSALCTCATARFAQALAPSSSRPAARWLALLAAELPAPGAARCTGGAGCLIRALTGGRGWSGGAAATSPGACDGAAVEGHGVRRGMPPLMSVDLVLHALRLRLADAWVLLLHPLHSALALPRRPPRHASEDDAEGAQGPPSPSTAFHPLAFLATLPQPYRPGAARVLASHLFAALLQGKLAERTALEQLHSPRAQPEAMGTLASADLFFELRMAEVLRAAARLLEDAADCADSGTCVFGGDAAGRAAFPCWFRGEGDKQWRRGSCGVRGEELWWVPAEAVEVPRGAERDEKSDEAGSRTERRHASAVPAGSPAVGGAARAVPLQPGSCVAGLVSWVPVTQLAALNSHLYALPSASPAPSPSQPGSAQPVSPGAGVRATLAWALKPFRRRRRARTPTQEPVRWPRSASELVARWAQYVQWVQGKTAPVVLATSATPATQISSGGGDTALTHARLAQAAVDAALARAAAQPAVNALAVTPASMVALPLPPSLPSLPSPEVGSSLELESHDGLQRAQDSAAVGDGDVVTEGEGADEGSPRTPSRAKPASLERRSPGPVATGVAGGVAAQSTPAASTGGALPMPPVPPVLTSPPGARHGHTHTAADLTSRGGASLRPRMGPRRGPSFAFAQPVTAPVLVPFAPLKVLSRPLVRLTQGLLSRYAPLLQPSKAGGQQRAAGDIAGGAVVLVAALGNGETASSHAHALLRLADQEAALALLRRVAVRSSPRLLTQLQCCALAQQDVVERMVAAQQLPTQPIVPTAHHAARVHASAAAHHTPTRPTADAHVGCARVQSAALAAPHTGLEQLRASAKARTQVQAVRSPQRSTAAVEEEAKCTGEDIRHLHGWQPQPDTEGSRVATLPALADLLSPGPCSVGRRVALPMPRAHSRSHHRYPAPAPGLLPSLSSESASGLSNPSLGPVAVATTATTATPLSAPTSPAPPAPAPLSRTVSLPCHSMRTHTPAAHALKADSALGEAGLLAQLLLRPGRASTAAAPRISLIAPSPAQTPLSSPVTPAKESTRALAFTPALSPLPSPQPSRLRVRLDPHHSRAQTPSPQRSPAGWIRVVDEQDDDEHSPMPLPVSPALVRTLASVRSLLSPRAHDGDAYIDARGYDAASAGRHGQRKPVEQEVDEASLCERKSDMSP